MVSQCRSLVAGSVALKSGTFCQEYVVLKDRWSLMPVVSQDRFHCTLFIIIDVQGLGWVSIYIPLSCRYWLTTQWYICVYMGQELCLQRSSDLRMCCGQMDLNITWIVLLVDDLILFQAFWYEFALLSGVGMVVAGGGYDICLLVIAVYVVYTDSFQCRLVILLPIYMLHVILYYFCISLSCLS